jgi:tRNA threonylcarbamoyladenosine biosynthesis protein TsaB
MFLICSIDTSGKNGSVALARYTRDLDAGAAVSADFLEVLDRQTLKGGDYSAHLLPSIIATLEKNALQKTDIALFAVASGPGSFTGLRVGMATVKALAFALQKPIAAITVLEAIALASKREGRVIAAMDAQRGELFAGEYTTSASSLHSEYEAMFTAEQFRKWMSERDSKGVTVTPDASVAMLLREWKLPMEEIAQPGAEVFALAGLIKYTAGATISPDELDANYIRRSDAEVLLDSKPATNMK